MSPLSEEEPWEAEIGAMLGRLPAVEPPDGFIDAALDHRPLHAGRVLGAMFMASVAAVVVAVLTGASTKSTVAPQIEELAQRHSTVQAGILGPGDGEVDYRVDTPLRLPDGFERTRNLAAEDIRQAFYDSGDTTVSVFVQDGAVKWESLPESGMTEINGVVAWVDEARSLAVVEASGRTVTIVGLPINDVESVLNTVPRSEPSVLERTQDLIGAVARQLGYPETS